MNTLKIINNNVNGRSDNSQNYFNEISSYAIRVYSDDDAVSYNSNPPKIIINGNFIDANYTQSAIRSLNNSTIKNNKIDGNFGSTAIFCLQDSDIDGNKISATCTSGIYTTINSNITNNNIKGFTQYGIRAAGKNISGNIISRDNTADIIAFIGGGTNGGAANNQSTLVVDNVFSHNTVDGLDKDLVKSTTNWIVERNVPDYVASSPIINIRSVNNLTELAALTNVEHNEIALVAQNYEDSTSSSNREISFGLWRFVRGSAKSSVTNLIVESNDGVGAWFVSDYSKINSSNGIAGLDNNKKLILSNDGISSITVNNGRTIDVYGDINVKSGGNINIESGAKINIAENGTITSANVATNSAGSGTSVSVVNQRSRVKVFKPSYTNQNVDIIVGDQDTWYDEYLINAEQSNADFCTFHLRCNNVSNIESYVGSRIRFSQLIKSEVGTVVVINAYTNKNKIQSSIRDFLIRHRDYDTGWGPPNNKWIWWIELVLLYDEDQDLYFWHPSAWTNWVSTDDILKNGG